jgi:hypothetical protein
MILTDYLVKWITTKKNLYGLIGFTLIMILLGINFSYWAGAIELGGGGNQDTVTNGDDDDILVPDDYDSGQISGSLPHGRHLVAFQQIVGDPRGEGEGETYDLYQFPIEANITGLEIVSGGDAGGSRIDGGDRNDIDIYIYAPDKDAGGDFDTTDPDYEGASPYIEEMIQLKKKSLDLGNWTLRVDCYTGSDVSYTVQIQVFYGGGNETKEGE